MQFVYFEGFLQGVILSLLFVRWLCPSGGTPPRIGQPLLDLFPVDTGSTRLRWAGADLVVGDSNISESPFMSSRICFGSFYLTVVARENHHLYYTVIHTNRVTAEMFANTPLSPDYYEWALADSLIFAWHWRLEDLVGSGRAPGLLQPLIVRCRGTQRSAPAAAQRRRHGKQLPASA